MKQKTIILLTIFIFSGFSAQTPFADSRGFTVTSVQSLSIDDLGNYYALIFGINNYIEWYPLKTAVKDAKQLKKVLIDEYTFDDKNIIIRLNDQATAKNLIKDLRNLSIKLKSNDNLLIYFAGHGQLDPLTDDGYWIPVDGKLKDFSTWIPHSIIKNILSSENVVAKNIVLISDSCYGGSLLRSGPSPLSIADRQYREKVLNLGTRRSRQVITSGGLEPVSDKGKNGHSLFAYYLIKSLRENKSDIIDLENLIISGVWRPVTEIGNQRPYIGRLKTPMDDNGQFVLISKTAGFKMASISDAKSNTDRKKSEQALANDFQNYAPIDKKVTLKKDFTPKSKIAIFPLRLRDKKNQALSESDLQKIATDALIWVFQDKNDYEISHSYYEFESEYKIKRIDNHILTKNRTDKLWEKKNFLSPHEPNVELVGTIGREIGVDFVITCKMLNRPAVLFDCEIYLIDIKNRKLYSKKETLGYPTIGAEFNYFARDFLASLLK